MSFQRITNLLSGGSIIDVSLISDSLKNVLKELCEMVSQQEGQIEFLRQELRRKVSQTELKDSIAELNEKSSQLIEEKVSRTVQELNGRFETLSDSMNKIHQVPNKYTDDRISQLRTECNERVSNVEKNVFVVSNQINDVNKQMKETKDHVQKARIDILTLSDRMKKVEDSSDMTLHEKLQALDKRVEKHVVDLRQEISDTKQIISGAENRNKEFESEMHDELTAFHIQILDLSSRIEPDNVLDIESGQPIDTPALVRAIQRDSRRIDKLNEFIASMKSEYDDNVSYFASFSHCLQQIYLSLRSLSIHYNESNILVQSKLIDEQNELIRLKNHLNHFCEDLSNSQNVQIQGINDINSAFLQIHSVIRQLSKAPIPSFKPFDDLTSNIQTVIDSISRLIDEIEQEKPLDPLRITAEFTVVDVPIPVFTQNKEPDETAPKSFAIEQSEFLQAISSLEERILSISSKNSSLIESIDSRIEHKADQMTIERMLEKVRTTVAGLRDKIGDVMKSVAQCITRDEAESIINSLYEQAAEEGGTQIWTTYGSKKKAQQPKSKPLPPLPGTQAHDAIFGTPKK